MHSYIHAQADVSKMVAELLQKNLTKKTAASAGKKGQVEHGDGFVLIEVSGASLSFA